MASQFVQVPSKSGSASGAAGGALTGTYPNPTINPSTTGIDTSNRVLYDSATQESIDWAHRQLFDSSLFPSIDWNARHLFDPGGNTVIDFNNFKINLSDGTLSIDWSNRTLNDMNGDALLNWEGPGALVIGAIQTISGQPVVGAGVPQVIGSNFIQNSSTATTNFVLATTVASATLCEVKIYLLCQTGGSTATVAVQLKWTDLSGVTQTVDPLSVTNISLTTAGTFSSANYVIMAAASTNILFSTIITGTIGTGRYACYVVLQRAY